MSTVEDRLHELRRFPTPGDLPPVDELARRGARRQRRRRARVATGGLAGLALVASLVVVQVTGDRGGDDQVVTEGLPASDTPPAPRGVVIEELSASGIPAVLVAWQTDINVGGDENGRGAEKIEGGDVAVIDLESGFRALYPEDAHPLDLEDSSASAVLTSRDDLLVWNPFTMSTMAFPAGRTDEGHNELLVGGLSQADREIYGSATEVIPTDEGDAAWVLSDVASRDKLQLIDVDTGDVRRTIDIPAQSHLVDVVGDDAVVYPGPVSGIPPITNILRVSSDGKTSPVEPPEPASYIGGTSDHSVWIAMDPDGPFGGDRVLLVGNDGDTTSVPVPEDDTEWTTGGNPYGSRTMPIVTSDGSRVLLMLTTKTDDGTTGRLVAVDIEEGTAEVIFDSPDGHGLGTAFWADDDRTVVVSHGQLESDSFGTTVTAVDTVTGSTTTIDDAVPEGYFQIVAGR